MRPKHQLHENFMRDSGLDRSYHASMIKSEANPTRTLTLVLPEADWKALRDA